LDFFTSETNMVDFLHYSPYSIHGTVHGGVGGIFGCDQFSSLLASNNIPSLDDLFTICRQWSTIIKELYRGNYIVASTSCETTETCGFVCVPENMATLNSKIEEQVSHTVYLNADIDWDAWSTWLCEGEAYKVFAGDHLESASPADPSFW